MKIQRVYVYNQLLWMELLLFMHTTSLRQQDKLNCCQIMDQHVCYWQCLVLTQTPLTFRFVHELMLLFASASSVFSMPHQGKWPYRTSQDQKFYWLSRQKADPLEEIDSNTVRKQGINDIIDSLYHNAGKVCVCVCCLLYGWLSYLQCRAPFKPVQVKM